MCEERRDWRKMFEERSDWREMCEETKLLKGDVCREVRLKGAS